MSEKEILFSQAQADEAHSVTVVDEAGREKQLWIPAERALTVYLNKCELVTLMTLGASPEALVLGYLRNQQLVGSLAEIKSVQVDWDVEAAAITTHDGVDRVGQRNAAKIVTTGCGQGTIYADLLDAVGQIELNRDARLSQASLVSMIDTVRRHDSLYKKAGSVHGCALFRGEKMLMFIEDVGRHNAVDSIAGRMWVEDVRGDDCVFFTTGRLTSEMVMKAAQMKIPFLLSRSGVTEMGLTMAKRVGMTLIARCSGVHFLLYHDQGRFLSDPSLSRLVKGQTLAAGQAS